MDEVALGRYRLLSLLGEGGMGKVYRTYDTMMDRDVAIKVLLPEMATEPGYGQRFQREALTAARLTEPHIIPVHEAGEIDGRLYLVMPIIEGTDVHSLLQREGPMSPQRAVHVVEQLAAALDAAHAAGLVHRDIKPSNALVTARDFVYLIDFGIAHDSSATKLTGTGMLVGTMAYMAPERFTAGVVPDVRSDVYALACVLYECLTGHQPYPGTGIEHQIAAHLTLDPPMPSAGRTDLPAAFDEVIATGMARNPDARYQSAHELATAARNAVSTSAPHRSHPSGNHYTVPAVPDTYRSSGPPSPAARPLWKQPRPILIGAILATALVVIAVVAIFQLLRPHSRAPLHSTGQAGPTTTVAGGIVQPVRATVFSPDGEPDSPDTAGYAIDSDPSTSWGTDIYHDQAAFPAFKSGVGLRLQLPRPAGVEAVNIDTPSTGTSVEVRSSTTPTPAALSDTILLVPTTILRPGHNAVSVNSSLPTSNLLVWISALGSTNGRSQTQISEITVRAAS